MRAEAPLPDDKDGPQHEHAGQHEARHHAGKEQTADRGFGGNAVEDEGDRRRNQDTERAAGANRAGGHVVRIAAPPHFRNSHLADGGAAGGRRAGERGEDGAGAEIGNDQSARQAVKPAVERLVKILAGRRRADRGAHHHEHRNGHEGKIVEAGPERLGDDMHAVDAVKKQKEDDRYRAEAKRDRDSRQQHQKGRNENDNTLRGRAHGTSPKACLAWSRPNSSKSSFGLRPKGSALPVTRQINSAKYCKTSSPRPNGIDR